MKKAFVAPALAMALPLCALATWPLCSAAHGRHENGAPQGAVFSGVQ